MLPLIMISMINVLLAWSDTNKIKNNEPISHDINAVIYVVIVFCFCLISHDPVNAISYLAIRIPLFNTSLNLFRGLPYDYHPKKPESFVDKCGSYVIDMFGYDNYNLFLILIAIIYA